MNDQSTSPEGIGAQPLHRTNELRQLASSHHLEKMAMDSICCLLKMWFLYSEFLSGLQDNTMNDMDIESDIPASSEVVEEEAKVGLIAPESFSQPTRMGRPMIEDPAVDVVKKILQ